MQARHEIKIQLHLFRDFIIFFLSHRFDNLRRWIRETRINTFNLYNSTTTTTTPTMIIINEIWSRLMPKIVDVFKCFFSFVVALIVPIDYEIYFWKRDDAVASAFYLLRCTIRNRPSHLPHPNNKYFMFRIEFRLCAFIWFFFFSLLFLLCFVIFHMEFDRFSWAWHVIYTLE